MTFARNRGLLFLFVFASAICLVLGCGKSRPKTIQVIGRVTLNGGKWPGRGAVYFVSTKPAPGYVHRPGHGIFNADGNFRAGTYAMDDGLIPGEYDIQVVYEKPHVWGDDVTPNSRITAKDKLTVPPDANEPIKYQFDVKHK